MKVLLVAEKPGTAIDKLCRMTMKAAPWHTYRLDYVHPKRPSEQQILTYWEDYEWCDIVDFRYWRTADLLREMYPVKKPCMLTHYNPYDLTRHSWDQYKENIVVNSQQLQILKQAAKLIPLPIDLDFWTFAEKKEPTRNILMVANRIEGKKGILEVAQAARDLNLPFILIGDISDSAYFQRVKEIAGDLLVFYQRISDEELKALYHVCAIHICNSIDNFESGTMPILEAMATGTPVLTRKVGHVPDLYNGTNMVVRKGEVGDIDDLKLKIQEMLSDQEWMDRIRRDAYYTLRRRGLELYGNQYSRLYHHIKSPEELVSVIMPVSRPPQQWMKTLAHVLALQTDDLEVIICDDSTNKQENRQLIEEVKKTTSVTLKYFDTSLYQMLPDPDKGESIIKKTYGLAHARNKGILEAEGKWLMFVDDRIQVEPDALQKFYARRKEHTWLWGVKDGAKKGFVENFSFISRAAMIQIGGFNEMITQYGGMSEEVRKRAELNKIRFEMVEEAKAGAAFKSSNRWTKQLDVAKSKTQCYKLHG